MRFFCSPVRPAPRSNFHYPTPIYIHRHTPRCLHNLYFSHGLNMIFIHENLVWRSLLCVVLSCKLLMARSAQIYLIYFVLLFPFRRSLSSIRTRPPFLSAQAALWRPFRRRSPSLSLPLACFVPSWRPGTHVQLSPRNDHTHVQSNTNSGAERLNFRFLLSNAYRTKRKRATRLPETYKLGLEFEIEKCGRESVE